MGKGGHAHVTHYSWHFLWAIKKRGKTGEKAGITWDREYLPQNCWPGCEFTGAFSLSLDTIGRNGQVVFGGTPTDTLGVFFATIRPLSPPFLHFIAFGGEVSFTAVDIFLSSSMPSVGVMNVTAAMGWFLRRKSHAREL